MPAYSCFVQLLLLFSSSGLFSKKCFVILLLYVKTQPFPSLCIVSDRLLASGLGTVDGSLAMPADSCSIIQCPGIIVFIHLDTGCVLQKIKKTCFENVLFFYTSSLGVC